MLRYIKSTCQLKDLGVPGVWERSLVSVVVGPSLLWSRLVPPCSSDFPGSLAEGSRPDMNSMLCFRLSSLSYRKDNQLCLMNLLVVIDDDAVFNHSEDNVRLSAAPICCSAARARSFNRTAKLLNECRS